MAKRWMLTLNTGRVIPQIGLGTWLSKSGEVGPAVEAAIKAGYRHIDCAHEYGNEAEIGEALHKCFKEGVVKREDIFVTSKLWNSEHELSSVLPACMLTLKNLQLDYLDLYLVHWPMASMKVDSQSDEEQLGYDADREASCWKGMEDVIAKKLAHSIGISNFSISKTERLLQTAKIVPVINQVECHPYFQQRKLKEYCDNKGILMESYSPLGNPGNPDLQSTDPRVLDDATIKEIAAKHHATVAQICISFALHRGLIVIPKTVNLERLKENLKSTEITLDTEDMRSLCEIENTTSIRYMKADWCMKSEWGDEDEYCWDKTQDNNFKFKSSDTH